MSGFQSGNSSSSTRGHERYYSRRVVPLRCFRVTNRDGLYRGFAFQSDAGLETPRFPEISVAENDPPTTGNEPSTAGKSESFVEPTAAINWTVDGSSAFRSRAEVRLDWNNCFQNATQKSIQISSLKTSESPYIRESWWGPNTTDILIYLFCPAPRPFGLLPFYCRVSPRCFWYSAPWIFVASPAKQCPYTSSMPFWWANKFFPIFFLANIRNISE